MKSVYEAPNALDAYMVLNLLEQEGIAGRVDGEYLPGGAGELQAINLVRVMVDEAEFERARQVIGDWESIQPEEDATPARKPAGVISGFMGGLVIGIGLMFWAYHTPVTEQGIDLNGDGVLDERRIYRDHRLSRIEVDRNLDGRPDAVRYYDRSGLVRAVEQDDDFDGIHETKYSYRNGQAHLQESDLNQDGNIDYRVSFRYGNLDEVMIYGEGRDTRIKRQRFHMGKRVSADYDTDGDGRFDTAHEYDYFEEIR